MTKRYRIEWMWDGQWRHEADGSLVYSTKEAAQNWERFMRQAGSIPQMTRIMEVR